MHWNGLQWSVKLSGSPSNSAPFFSRKLWSEGSVSGSCPHMKGNTWKWFGLLENKRRMSGLVLLPQACAAWGNGWMDGWMVWTLHKGESPVTNTSHPVFYRNDEEKNPGVKSLIKGDLGRPHQHFEFLLSWLWWTDSKRTLFRENVKRGETSGPPIPNGRLQDRKLIFHILFDLDIRVSPCATTISLLKLAHKTLL